MTFVEKAIERLNELIEQSAENSEEHTDYVVMKQACGKQLPKKISFGSNKNHEKDRFGGECGACITTLRKHTKYCPNCGQKIDWGDEQ